MLHLQRMMMVRTMRVLSTHDRPGSIKPATDNQTALKMKVNALLLPVLASLVLLETSCSSERTLDDASAIRTVEKVTTRMPLVFLMEWKGLTIRSENEMVGQGQVILHLTGHTPASPVSFYFHKTPDGGWALDQTEPALENFQTEKVDFSATDGGCTICGKWVHGNDWVEFKADSTCEVSQSGPTVSMTWSKPEGCAWITMSTSDRPRVGGLLEKGGRLFTQHGEEFMRQQ